MERYDGLPGPSKPWKRFLPAALALAILAGCTDPVPLVDVAGTVRLDDRPLPNVLVTFLPDPTRGTAGPCSRAVTDAQGRYRLRCEDRRPGAVLGWHRVLIEDLSCYEADRKENAPPPARSRVPAHYRSTTGTPLRRQVTSDSQPMDLDL